MNIESKKVDKVVKNKQMDISQQLVNYFSVASMMVVFTVGLASTIIASIKMFKK